MRGKLLLASLAAGLMLALPMALFAVDQQQPGMPQTDQPQLGTESQKANFLKVTDVIGMAVHGQNREKLGKIDNLVIDPNTGRVLYVVVAFNTEELSGKCLPMPWMALKCGSETKEYQREEKMAHHVILDINPDELAKAPSFQKGQWPDFNNTQWAAAIERFYRPILAKRAGETYNR